MDSLQPRSILIIRLSAIGDIIMASGLIPALRRRWPDAHLAWLAEESHAGLLAQHPRLDHVYRLPRQRWRSLRHAGEYGTLARETRQFICELRAARHDLVLDLQGLLKSGVWAWLSGSPRRIGLGSREGSQWLMTDIIPREMADPRIGKEYRHLGEILGSGTDDFQLDIPVPAAVEANAAELLRRAGLADGDSYAILAPFTTRPQKHWFDERWAELAGALGSRLTPIILGGPGDKSQGDHIVSLSSGRAINLAGQTSLPECAALIRNARLLVGVDTGLTHLGTAMNTPTVAIFGSTMPYLETSRPNGIVLYEPRSCSPCHRRPVCGQGFDCMRAQNVSQVLAAARRLCPALA